MSAIRQLVKRTLSGVLPRARFLDHGPTGSVVWSADHPPAETAALTFDDGPHPENTPPLLDALAEHDLIATFFVIGQQAERNPDLIRRIANEGHTLANHTYTHNEPKTTSAAVFDEELMRTRDLLEDLTGQPCALVRPPKGELTIGKFRKLWKRKETVVYWTLDPKDYAMTSDSEMEAWAAQVTISPGDILLFHDNHPWSITAIETLAKWQTKADRRFVSINAWLQNSASLAPTDEPPVEVTHT